MNFVLNFDDVLNIIKNKFCNIQLRKKALNCIFQESKMKVSTKNKVQNPRKIKISEFQKYNYDTKQLYYPFKYASLKKLDRDNLQDHIYYLNFDN